MSSTAPTDSELLSEGSQVITAVTSRELVVCDVEDATPNLRTSEVVPVASDSQNLSLGSFSSGSHNHQQTKTSKSGPAVPSSLPDSYLFDPSSSRLTIEEAELVVLKRFGTCGQCCLCLRRFSTSLYLPLGLLAVITLGAVLGMTGFWATMYGSEMVERRSNVASAAFLRNFEASRSYYDGITDAVQTSWGIAEGGLWNEIMDGLIGQEDGVNLTMIEVWANSARGLIRATGDTKGWIGVTLSRTGLDEAFVMIHANEVYAGNVTGDGLLHLFTVAPSVDALANGAEEYSLTEVYAFPLSWMNIDNARAYDGRYDDPVFETAVFCPFDGCAYVKDLIIMYNDARFFDGLLVSYWVSLSCLEISKLQKETCAHEDCYLSWIVDLRGNSLVAVSSVENPNELMNVAERRPLSPDEFGNDVVEKLSQTALELYEDRSEEDESVVQLSIDGMSVYFGFLNYSDAAADYVIIQANTNKQSKSQITSSVVGSVLVVLVVATSIFSAWIIIFCCALCSMAQLISRFRDSLHWMDLSDTKVRGCLACFLFFREIRFFDDQFLMMRSRLLEWKKFLPATLLQTFANGEDSIIDSSSSFMDEDSCPSSGASKNSQISKRSSVRGDDPLLHGFSQVSGTFACLLFEEFDYYSKSVAFEAVLSRVESLAVQYTGTVLDYSIESRSILVGFGVVECTRKSKTPPLGIPTQNAGNFAARLCEEGGDAEEQLRFSVGLSSGSSSFLTVGTSRRKKRAHLGKAILEAKDVARFCLEVQSRPRVIATSLSFHRRFLEEMETLHRMTRVAQASEIVFEKERVFVLCRLSLPFVEIVDDDEWMYAHARKELKKDISKVNSAFASLARNNIDECRGHISEVSAETFAETVKSLQSVCEKIEDGDVFEFARGILQQKRARWMPDSEGDFPSSVRLFADDEFWPALREV